MKKPVYIICLGSSAATLSCAAQLKRLDKNIRVTILTAQSEKPNNTCLLADYVAGKRTKESLYLPIPEGVTIHYSSEVVSVDTETKRVIARNGQEYFYDKLFIGTGLHARIPEIFIPELNKKVFSFKSLDDIVRFEEKKKTSKNVLVIGGGVTGIEAAHALKVRGFAVTVAEKNSRILPMFNQEISQKIHELLETNGVNILLNYQINQNYICDYDTVFLATGGMPAIDFLHGRIQLENGFIVVNEFQQTSVPDIFAGGDVCVGRVLWPQAVKDGVLAAYSILNHSAPTFKLIPYKTVMSIFNATYILS